VHYPELAARITRILARREGRREGPCRIGDLTINPATREVRVGARPVELAAKEFALLRALAADPRRVLTKEELLRDVWGYRSLGRTRTLDSHASRLRRKLDPEHSRFVHNCWGVAQRHLFGPIRVRGPREPAGS
jgi:DNA-binding response OmpR family regulator